MIVNYRSKICKGNTIANKRLVYQGLAGMLFTLQYYSFCTITWNRVCSDSVKLLEPFIAVAVQQTFKIGYTYIPQYTFCEL